MIGIVLDTTHSIDELAASLSASYDSMGLYAYSAPTNLYPIEDGHVWTSFRSVWTSYAQYRAHLEGRDEEHDELRLYGLGTSAEGKFFETRSLNSMANLIATTSDGLEYFKYELLEGESGVGSLQLARVGPAGAYVSSEDWLWTSQNGTFFEPTKRDLLPILEAGLDVEDWAFSVFLLTGGKTVELGASDDTVRTFYPEHYRSNNGYKPEDIDRSPTGQYTGGSFLDGGEGFDRLVYDDGEFYYSFREVPRSDAQKFLREDFEISVSGDPADHTVKVTNTKYGWTDTVVGFEDLEFAIAGSGTGSVTVNVTPVFTNDADKVNFDRLDFDEMLERVEIGYPVDTARGGDDHVRLPSTFYLGLSGPSKTSEETNNFKAGKGSDTVIGSAHQDFVRGGAHADYLFGRGNADKLFGEKGRDWIEGNKEDDWVSGGAGKDRLWGGAGDDYVVGGAGADRITGDGGNDKLKGGAGADSFIFGADFGVDKILDFDATGRKKQQDRLVFKGLKEEVENFSDFIDASREKKNKVVYDFGPAGENKLILVGVTLDDLTHHHIDFL